MTEIESEFKVLKRKQETWESLVNKIQRVSEEFQQTVKLNFRGKLFTVSKETLMTIESTYFYGLITNSDKFKPSEDGAFFIERNPLVLGRILDYLRTGKMDTRDLTPYTLDMLKDDVGYYCIPTPPKWQLQWNSAINYDLRDASLQSSKPKGEGDCNCTVGLIDNDVQSIVTKIESELNMLRRKQETWESLVSKIQLALFQQTVKLNVREKLFIVSKETLMSIESTYFYGLITNSDKFRPSEDGSFFIERNPLVVDRILDYLRTGKMDTRDLTPYELDMLKDDIDYYCIPTPPELQLHWDVTKTPANCVLSDH